jgi:EAL domain-containing protein (putative c-di-GMP-specific phosphodiesterase class I)
MAIAEQSGLIVPLGEQLIRRACRDAADWPKSISLAINLSSAQFRKSDLLAVINSALVVSGLTPRRLEVEVTESVLHEDDGRFIETLQQLRAMGVSVSLDHFGTGYSSFAYLTKFQFDKIKIDGVFTKAVVGSVEGMMIVSAACSLARGLNMVSIGDDVETEDQLEILRAAGISLAQGGLFGDPRPIAELQFDNAAAPTAASVAICAG